MPFNGSGIYEPIAAPDFPAVPLTTIRAAQYNNQINDMATALSQCLTRNGEGPALANIPMGGFQLTGLGAPNVAGQALVWGQPAVAETLRVNAPRSLAAGSVGTTYSDISATAAKWGTRVDTSNVFNFDYYNGTIWNSPLKLDNAGNATLLGTLTMGSAFEERNGFINGAMQVDQRNNGNVLTVVGGASPLAFGPDRWQVRSGGSNCTVQQRTVSGSNLQCLRFTGAAGNTGVGLHQRLDAFTSSQYAGKTATVSFTASSSSLTSIALEAFYANTKESFGTWASPTVTSIGSYPLTIGATDQRVRVSFAIPSAAYTGLEFRFTAGALLASQTLDIRDLKLEEGSVDTPFVARPYQQELALCQRYLPKLTAGQAFAQFAPGYASSTVTAQIVAALPVPTRVPPTGITTTGNLRLLTGGTVIALSTNPQIAASGASTTSCGFTVGVASGLTLGQGVILGAANDAKASIQFDGCEL